MTDKFEKSGKISHLERWIHQRRADDKEGKPLLYYSPQDNVIIGRDAIMSYLSIRSEATFYQYVEILGLPAIKRLDGQWMTTMSSIDQWIFIASEIDNANRGRTRATNARLEKAAERINRQIRLNRAAQTEETT
jgi:hypothetical protein